MLKKIITYLFIKYYYEDWVADILRKENEQIMKENNITEEELPQYFSDKQQQEQEGAYSAGIERGYDLAIKDTGNGI
jgi:hypothetical protein